MQPYYHETRRLLILAIPVIISQIAQTAFGSIDAIMSGRISSVDQAAIGIACAIFLPVLLFGHGLIVALTSVVAQLNGSKARHEIAHPVFQSVWLTLFISIPIMLLLYCTAPLVAHDPLNLELERLTIGYLRGVLWGVPGYLFFIVIRSLNDGLSKTLPGMFISCIGLLLNLPVNYAFIYGKFGAPALGAAGCGITTAIIYWSMAFAFLLYVLRDKAQKDVGAFKRYERPDKPTLQYLIQLGFPTGLAYFFETSLFAIAPKLLADLGYIEVAAHTSAITYSSLVFVLPVSVGITATIRVGHCLGEGSLKATRIATASAISVALLFSILTATLTLLFRTEIADIYTKDPAVSKLMVRLLLFSAFFQCFDALQIVAAGVLRGYKDMRAILIATCISYWGLGFTSGYLLAKTNVIVPALGAVGFWIGFIIGISSAAFLLCSRIIYIQKQIAMKGIPLVSLS